MKATFDASGEVLVVTGGANGIGAASALAYARAGGTPVVLDVAHSAELEAVGVEQLQVDVGDREAVADAFERVTARHGGVHGLVAAAAVQPRTALADMHPDEWRRTLAVNLDGTVWAVQAALPSMRERRRGSIVVFSSGLAHMGRAEASAYAASKGALIGFVKSVAAEVVADRVRINVLFPGVVDTPQFRAANSDEERAHWLGTTGIGAPADVVGSILWLLSDAAALTGSTLTRECAFPAEEGVR